MELTLENLVNEIVNQEHSYYSSMMQAENEPFDEYVYWCAKWVVLYDIALKFDFVDKLKR